MTVEHVSRGLLVAEYPLLHDRGQGRAACLRWRSGTPRKSSGRGGGAGPQPTVIAVSAVHPGHCDTPSCRPFPSFLEGAQTGRGQAHCCGSGGPAGVCGNAMHAVRTQCEVLDVSKYSNPSFGPFSEVFGSVPGFF